MDEDKLKREYVELIISFKKNSQEATKSSYLAKLSQKLSFNEKVPAIVTPTSTIDQITETTTSPTISKESTISFKGVIKITIEGKKTREN